MQPLPMAKSTAEQPVRWHPATRELVGGVLAGAVNVTSGYPFDTVKVRLQASHGVYKGMSDCFLHIWRTEGVRGFFRGLTPPLIGGAAETGVNYLVYSRVLDLFRPQQQSQDSHHAPQRHNLQDSNAQLLPAIAQQVQQQQLALYQQQQQACQSLQQSTVPASATMHSSNTSNLPPLSAVPVAGAVAGVALSVILSPTELIKCRMQMAQFNSPLRCLRNVLETEGIRGLGRGFVPTLFREIPGNAIFFTVYEGLRRSWVGRPSHEHSQHSGSSSSSSSSAGPTADTDSSSNSSSHSRSQDRSSLAQFWQIALDAGSAVICGGIAGVVMWTSILPLDVAKTRIQTAQPGSDWDTSVPKQLTLLWRQGGFRSLWAGLAPTATRAFPANACQWLAWEVAMRQLLPPALEPSSGSEADNSSQLLHGQQAATL